MVKIYLTIHSTSKKTSYTVEFIFVVEVKHEMETSITEKVSVKFLPFKIWVTKFFVSMCWSNRAWYSSLTCLSFSGWLLLMKATKASPVSSKSWNLWPWAIVQTQVAKKHITEIKFNIILVTYATCTNANKQTIVICTCTFDTNL